MSGRFPGARDLDEFWSNLRAGVRSIRRFSDDELTLITTNTGQAWTDQDFPTAQFYIAIT